MDATTKERADRDVVTPLNLASFGGPGLSRAEIMANVAEGAVQAGIGYKAGGRGVEGVDGFGFLRLCADFASPNDLGDLYGYRGWPNEEPWDLRVANMVEEWGLTNVGGHDFHDLRRGDVIFFNGPGPAAEILVSPANHDRGALSALCWPPSQPLIHRFSPRYSGRIQVRVYRWLEA